MVDGASRTPKHRCIAFVHIQGRTALHDCLTTLLLRVWLHMFAQTAMGHENHHLQGTINVGYDQAS